MTLLVAGLVASAHRLRFAVDLPLAHELGADRLARIVALLAMQRTIAPRGALT